MTDLKAAWGHLIFWCTRLRLQVINSKDYLENVTREGFNMAHDISSYSLSALVKHARPLMNAGAVVAMTYQGSNASCLTIM